MVQILRYWEEIWKHGKRPICLAVVVWPSELYWLSAIIPTRRSAIIFDPVLLLFELLLEFRGDALLHRQSSVSVLRLSDVFHWKNENIYCHRRYSNKLASGVLVWLWWSGCVFRRWLNFIYIHCKKEWSSAPDRCFYEDVRLRMDQAPSCPPCHLQRRLWQWSQESIDCEVRIHGHWFPLG